MSHLSLNNLFICIVVSVVILFLLYLIPTGAKSSTKKEEKKVDEKKVEEKKVEVKKIEDKNIEKSNVKMVENIDTLNKNDVNNDKNHMENIIVHNNIINSQDKISDKDFEFKNDNYLYDLFTDNDKSEIDDEYKKEIGLKNNIDDDEVIKTNFRSSIDYNVSNNSKAYLPKSFYNGTLYNNRNKDEDVNKYDKNILAQFESMSDKAKLIILANLFENRNK